MTSIRDLYTKEETQVTGGSGQTISFVSLVESGEIVQSGYYHIPEDVATNITLDASNLVTNAHVLAYNNTAASYVYIIGLNSIDGVVIAANRGVRVSPGAYIDLLITNDLSDAVAIAGSYTLSVVSLEMTDPYLANVVLLLDAEQSTIEDTSISPKTLTVVGNTALSTTKAKWGDTSIYFDGNGDYLTSPYTGDSVFLNDSFTIEAWIYKTVGSDVSVFSTTPAVASVGRQLNISNVLAFSSGGGTLSFASTATVPLNIWTHVSVSRVGSSVYLSVNGITVGFTNYTVPTETQTTFYIGKSARPSDYLNYMGGYMDSLRITKGVARYTSNFPVVPKDPYYTSVVLQLEGDTISGVSTTTRDRSIYERAITFNGDAVVSTAQLKEGVGSYYFDGSGDYLLPPITPDLSFDGSFTVEFWYRHDAVAQANGRIYKQRSGDVFGGFEINFNAAGTVIQLWHSTNNTSGNIVNAATLLTPTIGNWYHIAISNNNGSCKVFVDGIAVYTYSGTWPGHDTSTFQTCIGVQPGTSRSINGYINSLRVTKGKARYTANFNPDYAYNGDPYLDNVVLYLKGDGTNGSADITDSSLFPKAITVNGDAQISTTQSKYGGSSLYFDGVNAYLEVIESSVFSFEADFTIECWFYPISSTADQAILTIGTYMDGVLFRTKSTGGLIYGQGQLWYPASSPSLNTWHHLAVSRQGSTVTGFLDGIASTSTTLAGTVNTGISSIRIGSPYPSNLSVAMNGYIDSLRVTKGVARYTSNFDPDIETYLYY